MAARFPLILIAGTAMLSTAFGKGDTQISSSSSVPATAAPVVLSATTSSAGYKVEAEKPGSAEAPKADPTDKDKTLLNRLLKELKSSPRSFIYLRSVGFTQNDEEFERLIVTNSSMFKRTRIVRREENGNRLIPGWPGITLTDEYKSAQR